ncbi:glycosyltransferase family 4 protein [Bacillus sp. EB106-08-02-XG196]|jgi:glycosyltransferase involved in cell wall biosynthesis|uniref:glycosyltransferase family 4 protein n=1 Tax=Bacillus sp. EB106-08-02-XG196 TaxID=2737049 RepID=UPI0015C4DA1C|nr:glycosyltransferase family 4 protein [Bacillus sp. EB106-08-02-XG196]NWQ39482.1 glycosyltransferase family 4 protein [Bacillus sp. EB106-08-02-XG196]
MKICHLTSVHPTEDIRIFVKECRYLQKSGFDTYLIAANSDTYIKDGVKIVGVKVEASGRIMRILKGPAAVYKKALELDADVYHFHDPELLPIGLLLKNKGKKVIYDVHEDVPEQVLSKHWIPSILRKSISRVVKGIEKFASKRFAAVVTATPTINNRFKTYNTNSVTIHNFPITDELISEELPLSGDKKTAIYIGGISEERGIVEMIDAIEMVNQKAPITLTLAGKFSPESLENQVKKQSGWKYVDHAGWLNREQVKSYLGQAFVGLVILRPEPRYMVAYPIKLFEYMSAGIPVIASNFSLWKEIVEDSQCGLCVDPLNIEEISEAILWMSKNPEEAKKLGQNGREAILKKYSWENEAARLVELYKSL